MSTMTTEVSNANNYDDDEDIFDDNNDAGDDEEAWNIINAMTIDSTLQLFIIVYTIYQLAQGH